MRLYAALITRLSSVQVTAHRLQAVSETQTRRGLCFCRGQSRPILALTNIATSSPVTGIMLERRIVAIGPSPGQQDEGTTETEKTRMNLRPIQQWIPPPF
jgi:hypothetical protein